VLVALAGPACAQEEAPRTKVLIFRGVFNVFSLGLDTLAGDLEKQGYDVRIIPPSMGVIPAAEIRAEYLADPQNAPPIIFVGHSMGGRLCLHVAHWFQQSRIPVESVVILDSNVLATVPPNVKRCVNLYVTNITGVFHGGPVHAQVTGTPVFNVDVSKIRRPKNSWTVDHFNIDDSQWMRAVVIGEINRIGPNPVRR